MNKTTKPIVREIDISETRIRNKIKALALNESVGPDCVHSKII